MNTGPKSFRSAKVSAFKDGLGRRGATADTHVNWEIWEYSLKVGCTGLELLRLLKVLI